MTGRRTGVLLALALGLVVAAIAVVGVLTGSSGPGAGSHEVPATPEALAVVAADRLSVDIDGVGTVGADGTDDIEDENDHEPEDAVQSVLTVPYDDGECACLTLTAWRLSDDESFTDAAGSCEDDADYCDEWETDGHRVRMYWSPTIDEDMGDVTVLVEDGDEVHRARASAEEEGVGYDIPGDVRATDWGLDVDELVEVLTDDRFGLRTPEVTVRQGDREFG